MLRYRIDPDRSTVVVEARSSVGPIAWEGVGPSGEFAVAGTDGEIHPGSDPGGWERLETQAALADAQERLRDLQSLGDVGLWRWVPDEDEVQWSEQLYRIHDLDPLEFDGDLDGHVSAIREDDRDEVRRALREIADHGHPFEEAYVIVRRDGEERTVYSRADPVLDDDGAVAAVTGIGLATVREVAEGHGTTVTVTDSDVGGACFALRLRPVADEREGRDGGDELRSVPRGGGQAS